MSDLIKRLCRPGYDLQKEQAIQEAIIEIRELRAKIEETPYGAIAKTLTEVMDIAAANGADSRSMPDEYVEVAAWLCGIPGAQPAPSFADAYQGAMEEVAIWKRRALEAEDLNRKFVAEINGPAYMGEPAQPTPSVPEITIEMEHAFYEKVTVTRVGSIVGLAEGIKAAMLAAVPEAKP